MGLTAAGAVGLSLTGDLLFEEPPERVHPVAWFGRVVAAVDREWRRPKVIGLVVAVVLPLVAGLLAAATTAAALAISTALAGVLAGLVLFSTVSLRMLVSVAQEVIDGTESDPATARESVSALVGRDTAALSPGELRSGAVESAAENLADGVVAPLAAFAVGVHLSLAVGVGAAVWVKAVNTLDSMLGYRSKPVGWASARLDDVAMWIPARVSAGCIALAAGDPAAMVRAGQWASAPPSPNSGWPMATLAAVLDVKLVKTDAYVLNPERDLPSAAEARRGTRIVAVAGAVAFLLAGVAAGAAGVIG
ncbi:cobalamin biosynthesis protein CobD [Halovenus sp. WSH3]|uniref:Probable cobalamin biosynthesis protein CobD n=1 Tax=Halovenus carboxidivorans TaxID=2692199 RepID=A0A6B0SXT8_9EURY|nr:adenosylcobinamide-phosphate synthase CbiB [Halovenus carboxidivorans]MXR50017.1 cobalamin biosynthesis protein CobD [Halovenus carboxidivorans]